MYTVLLIFQVLLGIAIVTLVLLQHGKGADAGAAFGSGASATVFGARGSANFLSRTTAVLATLFFINSIALSNRHVIGTPQATPSVAEKVKPLEAPATGQGAPEPKTSPAQAPAGDQAAGKAAPGESGKAPSDLPPVGKPQAAASPTGGSGQTAPAGETAQGDGASGKAPAPGASKEDAH
ncbi:MAG: preprotein translocase subunit SecG [Gammaproteobacteria bacterium]|nr:MAG: preprotein translocase subunit SecG [Gammaproteobacteria bacterium]